MPKLKTDQKAVRLIRKVVAQISEPTVKAHALVHVVVHSQNPKVLNEIRRLKPKFQLWEMDDFQFALIGALLALGKLEEARKETQKLSCERYRANAFISIARRSRENRDFKEARRLATLSSKSSAECQFYLWLNIFKLRRITSDLQKAFDILPQITDYLSRRDALEAFVRA